MRYAEHNGNILKKRPKINKIGALPQTPSGSRGLPEPLREPRNGGARGDLFPRCFQSYFLFPLAPPNRPGHTRRVQGFPS